jgi:hypothetical protein
MSMIGEAVVIMLGFFAPVALSGSGVLMLPNARRQGTL